MSEEESERGLFRGLGVTDINRPVTRSVSRALENQVVGSILNQIDTGVERPVDFLPLDFFNRCASRVFGTSEIEPQNTIATTSEVPFAESDTSLSFSRKIDLLCQMSEDREQGAMGGDDQVDGGPIRDSEAGGSKSQRSEPASTVTSIEQLSRLTAMMMQQNEMMSQCMNEVRHMKGNVANLSGRVTEMETSAQALGHRSTVASTPEHRGRAEEAGVRSNGHRNNGNAERSEQASSEPPRWKKIDLEKWHIKFDGTGKGMSVESFIFRVEKLREQNNISFF